MSLLLTINVENSILIVQFRGDKMFIDRLKTKFNTKEPIITNEI